jgi:hypothetical protein
VLVAAVLFGAVWRFGGFAERQRAFQTVQPATLIAAGPYEFTFTEATARHRLATDYRKGSWEVTVIGTGRTTGEETISPDTWSDDSPFRARNDVTGDAAIPDGQRFGTAEAGSGAFTPGLPAIPYSVTFEFGDAFRPAPNLVFAVIDQRFGNRALVQTEQDTDQYWYNTRNGWRMELPLRELPPDKG